MFEDFWGGGRRGPQPHRHWDAARRGPPWARGGAWGPRRPGAAEWFGDLFGPPPRAERGGVRYLVLDAIADQARHGYEVIQAIEERSGGQYRPSPGVVYPTLQLLEELGHARVSEQDARKVYAITDEGSQDLAAHREEVADFYDRFVDNSWERSVEDFGELIHRAARLFKHFRRAARRGHLSGAAQARIRTILHEAVQQIEAVLSEEERPR